MATFIPKGMGWHPDLPDARDFTFKHPQILDMLRRLKRHKVKTLPDVVDLRQDDEGVYFADAEDQGPLNSSVAFAVLGLAEYFERRIHGRTFEGSKSFLYKVIRNRIAKRMRGTGDCGADFRTALKVLTHFGAPPEEHWPYNVERFDDEPSAFLYGLAKPLSKLRYFRLDEPNSSGDSTWLTIKSFLAAGFPVAFGFPVPSSLTDSPNIPYRPEFDSPRGGQAVISVGYRTNHFGNHQDGLLIRCSWGKQWGDNGNGWLPVSFIRQQLARDFWAVISDESLESGELMRPSVVDAPAS